jgi:hypothetical protein
MKTKRTLYAKGLKFGVILLAVVSFMFIPHGISAQEDTTPPVVLDFTIAPVVFDTMIADAILDFCVTAADLGTGLGGGSLDNSLTATAPGIGQLFTTSFGFTEGANQDTKCLSVTVPRYSPLGTFFLQLTVRDRFGTAATYRHPAIGVPDDPNLCDVGPCELENRLSGPLPDSDNDDIPDDADNCPDDSNPGQEDSDLDLIGDVCDPFPNDRDNEQAQCEEDLSDCLDNSIFADADDDGEADSTDLCPDTPPDIEVDGDGCSLQQFCTAIDTSSRHGRKICRHSDWQNDEPLKYRGDCKTIRQGKGLSNFKCVPR